MLSISEKTFEGLRQQFIFAKAVNTSAVQDNIRFAKASLQFSKQAEGTSVVPKFAKNLNIAP